MPVPAIATADRCPAAMDDQALELSLGLSSALSSGKRRRSSSESSESDGNSGKKRKCPAGAVELHFDDRPLPLDWEQCLDLRSGKMYYVNKKTQKRCCTRPTADDDRRHPLDLNVDVNMSTSARSTTFVADFAGGMLAAPCVNCHLLVMLSRSSPSCPNCKFLHRVPPAPAKVAAQQMSKLLDGSKRMSRRCFGSSLEPSPLGGS